MNLFHLWCRMVKNGLNQPGSRRASQGRRLTNASELLEERALLSAATVEYRSIDGTGNNAVNPDWGSTGIDFLRIAPADYANGISEPGGEDRPSPREISNAVADHGEDEVKNNRQLSALIYAWGQFIDHDIDLTNTADPEEAFNIQVPTGDPYFDPAGTGTQEIPLKRSNFDAETGDSTSNPRQQINDITAYLDGSMIYGSDATTAASLRTFVGGKLKTSEGNLLPVDDESGMFEAGDVRANENIELLSLQTLFVREHNQVANRIAKDHPEFTDEQIYQEARRYVIAEIQAITYNEFLPALLGPGAIPSYQGYNPTVNPGIANEFATAAYRVGHTLLNDDIGFLDNNGEEVHDEVSLAEAFFNPDLVRETGIDSILKYLASDTAEEIDTQLVGSVRNFLFGPPGSGGLDLASLNIQRGRDHGLADYNSVREAYGLPRVTSFAEITSDVDLQQKLEELYGSVDNIDLWVGGLAEDHAPGGSVGMTFRTIIADQFIRLRDGDRFWYQKTFSGQELSRLQNTHLSDIIGRNTTTTNLQQNVFFFKAEINGHVYADANGDGRQNPGEQNLAGRRIELLNGAGEVIRSTVTNQQGEYRFNALEIGLYQVREVAPPGAQVTEAPKAELRITRGMTIGNQNFGEGPAQAPPPSAVGTFRDGTWYLDSNNNKSWNFSISSTRQSDARFTLGMSGDLPVTGDWNGNGGTEVGVFRNGYFYLDTNGNKQWDSATGGDALFRFGTAGDIPVSGDWNSDGKTDVGVYRDGYFYLDANGNHQWDGTSAGDLKIRFGMAGDIPVTGDWNGDHITDLGVYRNGYFYLDTNGNRQWNSGPTGDQTFRFGSAGDTPFSGDWNGDGKTDIGVARNGVMYLDANGNHKWDNTTGGDIRLGFGAAGDLPVSGIWHAPRPVNSSPTGATLVSTGEITGASSSPATPLSTMIAASAPSVTTGTQGESGSETSAVSQMPKKVPGTPLSETEMTLRDQLFSECALNGMLG